MRTLLKISLSAGLLCSIPTCNAVSSEHISPKSLSVRLEEKLNAKRNSDLSGLISNQEISYLENRYQEFINDFPNAKWRVSPRGALKDGRESLGIHVKGNKKIAGQNFSLESKQLLAVRVRGGKIIDQELISGFSLLHSNKGNLAINISAPDTVLTGTRYDFDIIVEEPLGEAIIAGGLAPVTQEQVRNNMSPNLDLAPIGGGGLFKRLQAPLKPCTQSWAAILAHPDGIIAITKSIRVVESKDELLSL